MSLEFLVKEIRHTLAGFEGAYLSDFSTDDLYRVQAWANMHDSSMLVDINDELSFRESGRYE